MKYRRNADEPFRELQRLADQGDLIAKERLLGHQARLRGYPIGPWDDKNWLEDFTAGVDSLRQQVLREGQILYLSDTYDERRPRTGPTNNEHRLYLHNNTSFQAQTFAFYTKGCLWLDMMTMTAGSDHNYHVEGFMVVFAGDEVLWRTIFYPYAEKCDAVWYMRDRFPGRPLIEAYLDETEKVHLRRLED